MIKLEDNTKTTKQALCKVFDREYVSVKRDRGTASGWVLVKISLPCPQNCKCIWETKTATWAKPQYTYKTRGQFGINYQGRSTYLCEACLNLHEEARKKADKAISSCGNIYYHYCSDDGYGTERQEILVDIETIPTKEGEKPRCCNKCGDVLRVEDDLSCGYHNFES